MPSQAIPKEYAQRAIDELMGQVKSNAKSREAPFEYLQDTVTTDEIKHQWFAMSTFQLMETTANQNQS